MDIREAYAVDQTAVGVARLLGIHRMTAERRLFAAGLTPVPARRVGVTADQLRAAIEAVGARCGALAKHLEIGRTTVRMAAMREGIKLDVGPSGRPVGYRVSPARVDGCAVLLSRKARITCATPEEAAALAARVE